MENFIKIKGLTRKQEIAIINQLKDRESSYHNVPGWTNVDMFWIDISDINTQQPDGTTDNSIRLGGTGDQDSLEACLLYTSPSPRDLSTSRMPSSA